MEICNFNIPVDDLIEVYKGKFDESAIEKFFKLYDDYAREEHEGFPYYKRSKYYLIEKTGRSTKAKDLGKTTSIIAMYEYLKATGELVAVFMGMIKNRTGWKWEWDNVKYSLRDVIMDIVEQSYRYTDKRRKIHIETEK